MDLDLTSPADLLALRRQAEILAGAAEEEGRVYRAEALRGAGVVAVGGGDGDG